MKKLLLVVLAFAMLLASSEIASSQTRIRFARGAIRKDVSGTLNNHQSVRTYVIRVREGQTMQTQQIGGSTRPVTISIKDPAGNSVGDADASCNDRKEITPTTAGDYTIEVIECPKADAWRGRFTFRVTVR